MAQNGETARLSGRNPKILLAMNSLSGDESTYLPYEDIVVRAWEMYPHDFGLRGYVERYPDASDLHKNLYKELAKGGYVEAANKRFRLTARGLAAARALLAAEAPGGMQGTPARLGRPQEAELARLQNTRAFGLCRAGRVDDIVDTDLFEFFRVSPRTKHSEFVGRVHGITVLIREAVRNQPDLQPVLDCRDVLARKFANILDYVGYKE